MSDLTKKFAKFFKKEENPLEVQAKVIGKGVAIFQKALITRDMELNDLLEAKAELVEKREDALMNHGKLIKDNVNYLQSYYTLTEDLNDISEKISDLETTITVLKDGLGFLNS